MKMQRTTRSKKRISSSKRRVFPRSLAGLESLEARQLLTANVLLSTDSAIGVAGEVDDISMTLDISGTSSTATLIFVASPRDGSFNPAAPVIRTADGSVVPALSSINDSGGPNGRTVVSLGDGEYSVDIRGEASSTGAYRLEVSMLGDVDANDRTVSNFERLTASAALIQFLGNGNHVTSLFYQQHGINMTENQYDPGFDVNMNGVVEPFELSLIEKNQNAVINTIEFQADTAGPAITNLRVTNDTGVSTSDRITTDPRVSGQITDDSLISSVTARIDNLAAVEILGSLGDINAQADFTISQTLMDQIAGGSLAAGLHTITIVATDEFNNSSSSSLTFTFIPNNRAPEGLPIAARSTNEQVLFTYNVGVFFSDPDLGDILTFTATGMPNWMSITPQGVLSGTPGQADVGVSNIQVTATDSQGATVNGNVTITVVNVPDPPVIAPIGNRTAVVNQPFSVNIGSFVSDPDPGDVLTISVDRADGIDGQGNPVNLRDLPAWLSFNETTGILSGTPTFADAGTSVGVFVFVIDTIDGTGTASQFFTITVTDPDPNQAPVVNDATFTVLPGANPGTVVGTIQATDPDGDTLTFSVTGGTGLNLFNVNTSTGQITVAADANLLLGQSFTLNIRVVDDGLPPLDDTATITISVAESGPVANDDGGFDTEDFAEPLVITAASLLANDVAPTGTTLSITSVSSSSAQGASITFNATSGQITYDSASSAQLLALRPGQQVTDTFTYTISDGQGGMDSATVSILVDGTDSARYIVEAFNLAGTSVITSIQPGQEFLLRVSIEDLRELRDITPNLPGNDVPAGFFAAFIDVMFPSNLLTVTGEFDFTFFGQFGNFTQISGDVNTPGLINDAGGIGGTAPFDPDNPDFDPVFAIFEIEMTAGNTAGAAMFTTSAPEDQLNLGTLMYLDNRTVPVAQIVFESTTLNIVGAAAPLSAMATATNFVEPMDVDGDSLVTPKDALIIINGIQQGSFAAQHLPDVNADGNITPMDALLVLNHLQLGTPQAAMSASATNNGWHFGDAEDEDPRLALVDQVFADFG